MIPFKIYWSKGFLSQFNLVYNNKRIVNLTNSLRELHRVMFLTSYTDEPGLALSQ